MVKFNDEELEAVQRLVNDGFSSVTGLYRRFDALDGTSLSQSQFSSRLKGSVPDLDFPLWFREFRSSYFVDSKGSGKGRSSSQSLPASPHRTPSFLSERLEIRRRFITHPDFPLSLEKIAACEVEEFNARHIPEDHVEPVQVVAIHK